MNDKKPLKAKNLKVIDYMGNYYATFDGTKIWRVEKWVVNLLKLCNGKRTIDQIAEEVSKLCGYTPEDVKVGLKPLLEELEASGFITYV